MHFSEYIDIIAAFCRTSPFVAIACGALLLYLFYRRPKFFLSVLVIGLVLAVMVHFILTAASSGTYLKREMIDNTVVHNGDLIRSEGLPVLPAYSSLSVFKHALSGLISLGSAAS